MRKLNIYVIAGLLTLTGCGGEPAQADVDAAETNEEETRDAATSAEGGMKLCTHRLMELDKQLAESNLTEEQKAAFDLTRESASAMCASGQENLAVQMIDSMSASVAKASGIAGAANEDRAEEAEALPAEEDYALGEPRTDLERFYGLYALPDNPDRQLFVAPATSPNPDRPIPNGYLMVGAMWGDAANWYMKSEADTRFVQQWVSPGGSPIKVEFKTGANGAAEFMTFTSDYMNYQDMPRVSDLPDDWQ
ncbi:hypothetical protein [Hyphococcus sp.]|uniref:hypothetical protein n=1 Tax=Hyphococcus sp. TaxID=2038636 RepID=UPI003CCC0CAE